MFGSSGPQNHFSQLNLLSALKFIHYDHVQITYYILHNVSAFAFFWHLMHSFNKLPCPKGNICLLNVKDTI